MPRPERHGISPDGRVRVVDVEIPNDVRYIEKVVELVRRECRVMAYGERQLMLNVPVALTEALSNAILRGNGDDPGKHVRVHAEVGAERLVVEVGDEGPGFDLDASLIDPTTPENLGREDGRGLFLMRKLMDRVERLEAARGSVVRMTLHRE
ncbi:MAG TPA: ATP-binding protein [Gemmatimonadaceae bacterium]|jgi:serine/threonine-protein kinase RsbW|nr:ATP-binding protein [Gemmatimonadaceae bacterium]